MIARVAATACGLLVLCAVAILVVIDPSSTRCPGWFIVAKNGTSFSIWGLVAMQAAATVGIGFIALKWRWFAQRMIDKLRWAERTLEADAKAGFFEQFEAMSAVRSNPNWVFPIVCGGCVVFCSIPLLVIATQCA
jgi:hypothetical protein